MARNEENNRILRKIPEQLGKILYPYRCPFCGRVIREGDFGGNRAGICGDCRKKIVDISDAFCMKCGKPIRDARKEFCSDCSRRMPAFDAGRSLWVHQEPVSSALYRFKYQNQRYYGKVFADCLYKRFQKNLAMWQIDAIVPVPLHRSRFRKRGYNQAEIIALRLSERSGIPVRTDLVYRTGRTVPLKELGPTERKQNLQKAFTVTEAAGSCQNVLIIDDIYTTGATIGTIAGKMKRMGTRKVYFFTISIGQGF